MPEVVKNILKEENWKLQNVDNIDDANKVDSSDTIAVFPNEFFSPKSYETGEINITENTYSVHHFAASWHGSKEKIYKVLGKIIGKNNAKKIANLIKRILIRH